MKPQSSVNRILVLISGSLAILLIFFCMFTVSTAKAEKQFHQTNGESGDISTSNPLTVAQFTELKLSGEMPDAGKVYNPYEALALPDYEVSGDSQWVVFMADKVVNEHYYLYSAKTSGGVVNRLDPISDTNAGVRFFRITPDSSHVVFVVDSDPFSGTHTFNLWSAPIAGGQATKLDEQNPILYPPYTFQFSPDGSYVYYIGEETSTQRQTFYKALVAGGEITRISDNSYAESLKMLITPDGNSLIYVHNTTQVSPTVSFSSQLYSLDINTGILTTLKQPAETYVYPSTLQITEDGNHIFYVESTTSDAPTLISTDLVNRLSITLTRQPWSLSTDFNNDHIVYMDGDALYARSLQRGSPVPVSMMVEPQDSLRYVQLTSDGGHVLYQLIRNPSEFPQAELYSAAIDGSSIVKLSPALLRPDRPNHMTYVISNDGKKAYFTFNDRGTGFGGLYAVDIESGEIVTLSQPPLLGNCDGVGLFQLSNDDSHLVYFKSVCNDKYEFIAMTLESISTTTFKVNQLNSRYSFGEFSFRIAKSNFLQITPDSSKIILLADPERSLVYELFAYYDQPPTIGFSAASATAEEGGDSIRIPVYLSHAAIAATTVNLLLNPNDVMTGTDYSLQESNLIFLPGESCRFAILTRNDNSFQEPNTSATLKLSNPFNGVLGNQSSMQLSAIDDESEVFRVYMPSIATHTSTGSVTCR